MPRTTSVVASLAALLVVAGAASAQSRASFQTLQSLTGVSVNQVDALNYTVTIGAAPTMMFNSNLYTINSVFGFWLLSDDDNFAPAHANFLDPDGDQWSINDNNGGMGAITGWNANPNNAMTPADEPVNFSFTFLAGAFERYGFHIRVNETLPGGGNTAFFTVPTPGAAALLGLGTLLATRRRRA